MGCHQEVSLLLPLLVLHIPFVGSLNATIHSISTEECGLTKICLRDPPMCNGTRTCNAFITTSYDKSTDLLSIEMGTASDYLAFGHNEVKNEPVMVKLRGIYCSRASASDKNFGVFTGNELKTNGRPKFHYNVSGVTQISTKNVGGSLVCKFQRLAKPPADSSSLLYDLHKDLRLAMSYGAITGETLNKHHNKVFTPNPVRITDSKVYGTTPLNTTMCTQTNVKCERDPEDCDSSYNCQYLAIYIIDKENDVVDISISTTEKYVLFAHKSSSTNETKGQVCFKSKEDLPKLKSFRVNPDAVEYHTSITDGVSPKRTYIIPYPLRNPLVCTYTRKITVPEKSRDYTLEMDGTHETVHKYGNDFALVDQPDLTVLDPSYKNAKFAGVKNSEKNDETVDRSKRDKVKDGESDLKNKAKQNETGVDDNKSQSIIDSSNSGRNKSDLMSDQGKKNRTEKGAGNGNGKDDGNGGNDGDSSGKNGENGGDGDGNGKGAGDSNGNGDGKGDGGGDDKGGGSSGDSDGKGGGGANDKDGVDGGDVGGGGDDENGGDGKGKGGGEASGSRDGNSTRNGDHNGGKDVDGNGKDVGKGVDGNGKDGGGGGGGDGNGKGADDSDGDGNGKGGGDIMKDGGDGDGTGKGDGGRDGSTNGKGNGDGVGKGKGGGDTEDGGKGDGKRINKGGCMKSSIDLSACEKSTNCFRSPPNCTHPLVCNAIAKFKYEKEKEVIVVELGTTQQYVAFGQKEGSSRGVKMKGLKGQYCGKGSPTRFGTFQQDHLHFSDKPSLVKVDDVKVLSVEKSQNGVLVCKYEQKLKPSENNQKFLHDINKKLFTVLTYGPSDDEKPQFIVSKEKVDFTKVETITSKDEKLSVFFKSHGIFMMLGYLLFATVGIFISRYIKTLTREAEIVRNETWVVFHAVFMIVCTVCVIIGFTLVFVQIGGWTENAGKHQYTGLAAVIAYLLQPLMGFIRPGQNHKRRSLFNWVHHSMGILGWIAGGMSVTFALQMLGAGQVVPLIFIVLTMLLFSLCDICLAIYSTVEGDIGGTEEPNQESTEPTLHVVKVYDNSHFEVEMKSQVNKWIRRCIVLVFMFLVFSTALMVTQYLATLVYYW